MEESVADAVVHPAVLLHILRAERAELGGRLRVSTLPGSIEPMRELLLGAWGFGFSAGAVMLNASGSAVSLSYLSGDFDSVGSSAS